MEAWRRLSQERMVTESICRAGHGPAGAHHYAEPALRDFAWSEFLLGLSETLLGCQSSLYGYDCSESLGSSPFWAAP